MKNGLPEPGDIVSLWRYDRYDSKRGRYNEVGSLVPLTRTEEAVVSLLEDENGDSEEGD